MKALEKDRSRRYETANGFAAAVMRYLAGEPVNAHPPSATYRLRKFLRKRRGPVVAATLVVLALVAGIIGTTLGLIRAENARQAEAKQRRIAEEKESEALAAADSEARQRKEAERANGQPNTSPPPMPVERKLFLN